VVALPLAAGAGGAAGDDAAREEFLRYGEIVQVERFGRGVTGFAPRRRCICMG
jgi:hypothetical protein